MKTLLSDAFPSDILVPMSMIYFVAFKHLVVGNGGLGNGISRETIKVLFSPNGQIEHIVMQERKPYCFISYVDIESAEKAYASLHGMTLKSADQTPGVKLYLGYVDKG